MKTQIISGSHRLQSQSLKVSHYIQAELKAKGHEADVTDLSRNTLPLWDERVWDGDPEWKKIWNPIADKLRAADSFVVVCPEYNGMASPALKNFFLFCTGDLIAHKPAMIVTVSAGMGGSYPVSELRASGYKNTRIVYVPDHVIVRDAQHVLNAEKIKAAAGAPPTADELTRTRIDYSISMLNEYAKALKSVRESKIPNYKDFANGM